MNRKEEKAFFLQVLTEQAQTKFLDRRDFMRASMALGLSATTALVLFQACGGGDDPVAAPAATTAPAPAGAAPTTAPAAAPTAAPVKPAAEVADSLNYLVRRFPEINGMPVGLDLLTMWEPLEGKSYFYGAIVLANAFIQMASDVWKAESEKHGMDYSVVDVAFDPAKEVEVGDLAISRGFDLITLHPTNPAGLSPTVTRARADGRIVCHYDTDTFVRPTIKWGRGFFEDGFLVGQWMASRLKPGAKCVSGVGERLTTAGNGRPPGFKAGLESAGKGIELIADDDGHGWSFEGGYDMARTWMQRFPQIDAMYSGEDGTAVGMATAAMDVGRREGMLIGGCDGLKIGQEALADGRIDVSAFFLKGTGPELVACFNYNAALLRGKVHGDLMEAAHNIKRLAVDITNIAEQWPSPV